MSQLGPPSGPAPAGRSASPPPGPAGESLAKNTALARVLAKVTFDASGLCAAVAQDRLTGRVQMVAWMNLAALEASIQTGFATFYSRSRGKLWMKGESSGNRLAIEAIGVDCDGDTLLLTVEPEGPSCHTGATTCFFTSTAPAASSKPSQAVLAPLLDTLTQEIESRKTSDEARSYVKKLLNGGKELVNAKIREEAGELAEAIDHESDEQVVREAADLLFHTMVGLSLRGKTLRDVLAVLSERRGTSGLVEKAQRDRKPSAK